jgi:hypothetical protein
VDLPEALRGRVEIPAQQVNFRLAEVLRPVDAFNRAGRLRGDQRCRLRGAAATEQALHGAAETAGGTKAPLEAELPGGVETVQPVPRSPQHASRPGKQLESVLDLPAQERLQGEQTKDGGCHRSGTGRFSGVEPALKGSPDLRRVPTLARKQVIERVPEPSPGVFWRRQSPLEQSQRLVHEGDCGGQ